MKGGAGLRKLHLTLQSAVLQRERHAPRQNAWEQPDSVHIVPPS